MNNADTIKAITPIVSHYFSDGCGAETAMNAIGRALKENGTANPATNGRDIKPTPTGYHVFDRDGNPFSYPAATGFDIDDDGRLTIRGGGQEALAVFNRLAWTHMEKIAA